MQRQKHNKKLVKLHIVVFSSLPVEVEAAPDVPAAAEAEVEDEAAAAAAAAAAAVARQSKGCSGAMDG